MDMIEGIESISNYDYSELLNVVDFDELHDYVNIYDKSCTNLLIWLCENYEFVKASNLINKYHNIIDFNKTIENDIHNRDLLSLIILYSNELLCRTIIDRLTNMNNIQLLHLNDEYDIYHYAILANNYSFFKKLINSYGIICINRYQKKTNLWHHGVIYAISMTHSEMDILHIILNKFSILIKISKLVYIDEICDNINKLILIFGKY
jgi:hypothetical protein